MNINGYKKNKYHYNKCNCNNNIYLKNNNCCNNLNSAFNSLYEVENFLCNLKKISKCLNLYKFLK